VVLQIRGAARYRYLVGECRRPRALRGRFASCASDFVMGEYGGRRRHGEIARQLLAAAPGNRSVAALCPPNRAQPASRLVGARKDGGSKAHSHFGHDGERYRRRGVPFRRPARGGPGLLDMSSSVDVLASSSCDACRWQLTVSGTHADAVAQTRGRRKRTRTSSAAERPEHFAVSSSCTAFREHRYSFRRERVDHQGITSAARSSLQLRRTDARSGPAAFARRPVRACQLPAIHGHGIAPKSWELIGSEWTGAETALVRIVQEALDKVAATPSAHRADAARRCEQTVSPCATTASASIPPDGESVTPRGIAAHAGDGGGGGTLRIECVPVTAP